MRTNNRINVAIIIIMTALSGVMITSCSNEEATPTVESQSVEHVAYVATLSQEQQVLLASTGSPLWRDSSEGCLVIHHCS